MEFRPTRPPPGRLARLGVVLDPRHAPLSETARMCDGAGIDTLWFHDFPATAAKPRVEPLAELVRVGAEVHRPRLGVLMHSLPRPEVLAEAVSALDSANGDRLELCMGDLDSRPRRMQRYARRLGDLLGETGPKISIQASSPSQWVAAARVADDVQVLFPPIDTKSISEAVRTACDRADRDPVSLGVAALVPVSIGRTTAEAHARMEAEPGPWRALAKQFGIFGTLEQCQERVIDLAHAGVTDLRCMIPKVPDAHDVIAQLTAIVVGTIDVLAPGIPRSKAPDPPTGWGGRTNRA